MPNIEVGLTVRLPQRRQTQFDMNVLRILRVCSQTRFEQT